MLSSPHSGGWPFPPQEAKVGCPGTGKMARVPTGLSTQLSAEAFGTRHHQPSTLRSTPGPGEVALPDKHALQQLLVPLGVARPVLLHILVHTVLQCASTILGIHVGHLLEEAVQRVLVCLHQAILL